MNDNSNRSEGMNSESGRKNLQLRNQSFFINRLAQKNRSMVDMARTQGPQSEKGSENGKSNSLMHFMAEKNKLAVTS